VNGTKKPGIRILIAEDHPVVADGIEAILAAAKDITVVGQARDGAEAIELVKRSHPDIVLLDLRMPVVDGLGVARWIKTSGSTARTVILTIFHNERDIRQAVQAGAKAYLLKDAPPAEILKTIRRVYQGDSCISPDRAKELVPNATSRALKLKPQELKILELILQGDNNRTIGTKLGLRTNTVKYLLRGLFSKLGVRRRAGAARQAIERGLLQIEGTQEKPDTPVPPQPGSGRKRTPNRKQFSR